MAQIENLESIDRVFAVLSAISAGGGLTVSSVARATKLSRGAVNRYIYSLDRLGYVYRAPGTKKYFVSSKLLELTSNVNREDWIETVAYPIMSDACKRVRWPISLIALENDSIVDLVNTDTMSPLVTTPVARKTRHPIVGRAGAHVLLAGLSDEDRSERIHRAEESDPGLFSRSKLNHGLLEDLIGEIQKNGFGHFKLPGRNWAGLSVAVPVRDQVTYSLSLRYHPTAVPTRTAFKSFLPALESAARSLTAQLS